jgi:hypothetical protein
MLDNNIKPRSLKMIEQAKSDVGKHDDTHCDHLGCVVLVRVFVNDSNFDLAPGEYPEDEFKKAIGVPAAHDLELVKDGKIIPLKEKHPVKIRGCEKFIAHPREGCAS